MGKFCMSPYKDILYTREFTDFLWQIHTKGTCILAEPSPFSINAGVFTLTGAAYSLLLTVCVLLYTCIKQCYRKNKYNTASPFCSHPLGVGRA